MKKTILLITLLTTACTTYKEIPVQGHVEYFVKTADLYRRIDDIPQPRYKIKAEGIDLLRQVNDYVNKRITYANDIEGADYWQSPLETEEQRRGDCEDYAIYKMQLLASNGVPEKDMSVLVGYNFNEIQHAVLRVILDGKPYYLNNETTAIHGNPIVKPVYTINRFGYTRFENK